MALFYCQLYREYHNNPNEARFYLPEHIIKMKAREEIFICPYCQTQMYMYADNEFRHYANQPHKSEVCIKLSTSNVDVNRQGLLIGKLVATLAAYKDPREKKKTINGNNSTAFNGTDKNDDKLMTFDDIGVSMDELEYMPEDMLQKKLMEGCKEEIEKANSLLGIKKEDILTNKNTEDVKNAQVVSQDNTTTESESEQDKKNIDPPQERKFKDIKSIKDIYELGFDKSRAMVPIASYSDGTPIRAYEFIIAKQNWKYVFSNNLFHGGPRAIEMEFESFVEPGKVENDIGAEHLTPGYLIFKVFWRGGGKDNWKIVRFIISYKDEKSFNEFISDNLKEENVKDENTGIIKKMKLPKDDNCIYTIAASFEPANKTWCKRHCKHEITAKNNNKTNNYCINCEGCFKANLTFYNKTVHTQLYISGKKYSDAD